MSESEAFLAAICATPADDLPRLVYADWLDEHDQSNYAEFIRMQCEMDRVPRYEKVWAYARRDQAWWIHGKPYYGKLPQLPNGLEFVGPFRRGFPYAVRCEHPDLLVKHAELIFRLAPIEKLVLAMNDRDEESWWRFIRMPAFQRFQSLRLEGRHADVALDALQSLPQPTHIQQLELHGSAYDLQQLVRVGIAKYYSSLNRLVLELTDYELRSEFFRESSLNTRSTQARQFRSLEFCGSHNDLAPFREMVLRSSQTTLNEFITTEPFHSGFTSLLERLEFPELQILGIYAVRSLSNRILESVAARLGLRALTLRELGPARPEILEQLGHSHELTEMRLIDCSHSQIGNELSRALAKSPQFMKLYELRLQSCQLTDEAGIALMNSPYLKNLITLNLKGNTFSSPIIAGLKDRFGEALVL